MKIIDYKGWEINYDTDTREFGATRGRAKIKDLDYRNSQMSIEEAIDHRNLTEERKKAAIGRTPLAFRRWHDDLETDEVLVNFTVQGLRLESGKAATGFRGGSILMIPNGVDAGPLHRAVQLTREAEEATKKALADCTVEIVFDRQSENFKGSSPEQYAEAEDKARAAIEQANREIDSTCGENGINERQN